MKRNVLAILCAVLALSACSKNQPEQGISRKFIAHRGVDLNHTIAGENSLKAVELAKAAGFDAVETDVRYSKDGVLMVMHDENLNRTCLNSDGSEITEPTPIRDKTLEELKNNYILKADAAERRTRIPTLKEYLEHCKSVGMFVFIEPKLNDASGKYYQEIIDLADSIFGRNGYVVTSNNYANNVIRNTLNIKDVRLMGILYQTTYEAIQELGNTIFAISATRFEDPEYQANVAKAKADGYLTESTADKFVTMDMVNRSGVDWVSTDMLIPDYKGQGTQIQRNENHEVAFGGIWLELEFSGSATVQLANQKFSIESESGQTRRIRHQVALYNMKPVYKISNKSDDFKIVHESVKVAEF